MLAADVTGKLVPELQARGLYFVVKLLPGLVPLRSGIILKDLVTELGVINEPGSAGLAAE